MKLKLPFATLQYVGPCLLIIYSFKFEKSIGNWMKLWCYTLMTQYDTIKAPQFTYNSHKTHTSVSHEPSFQPFQQHDHHTHTIFQKQRHTSTCNTPTPSTHTHTLKWPLMSNDKPCRGHHVATATQDASTLTCNSLRVCLIAAVWPPC